MNIYILSCTQLHDSKLYLIKGIIYTLTEHYEFFAEAGAIKDG